MSRTAELHGCVIYDSWSLLCCRSVLHAKVFSCRLPFSPLDIRSTASSIPSITMSGLEALASVITIIEATNKLWKNAQKDLRFTETFRTVGNHLPVLLDTLETSKKHLEEVTLPQDAALGVQSTMQSCQTKAVKLHTIFDRTIPGETDKWYQRYRAVAQRLGKGSKVEELMRLLTEDTQKLVNYDVVKSARPDLNNKLEKIVKDLVTVQPSLPDHEYLSQSFTASSQNISTGSSSQHNYYHSGSGTLASFASVTGGTFNLGKS